MIREHSAAASEVMSTLVGLRCEAIDNPHGSIIRLELGEFANQVDDPPGARPHAYRHVTVYSPWRLENNERVLADWNLPGAPNDDIPQALAVLIGSHVLEAHCVMPSCDLDLRFTGGRRLYVFADSDPEDSSWFVLGTDGLSAAAGPLKASGGGFRIESRGAPGSA